MNFLSLLEAKRDGAVLSDGQISSIVADFTRGEIADYQMAALLMAIYFRGLTAAETRALTLSMRDSGDRLVFPEDSRPLVDKHSTGGVGDKVSLPLAPLLACLGFRVPMISGRGLGITGGTLDKLDSIPGFQTSLSREQIVAQVQSVGCVICGQTETMVPADKRLYALRDVTATVPSIGLITASIMSKKLAESLDVLLLDVKFGCAAFMQTRAEALKLARAMVELGRDCGVKTAALLTRMESPLGCAAGNWLEVRESVETLENRGPADLTELVVACAAHLLVQAGALPDLPGAERRARECLLSGRPREKFDQMLAAQGARMNDFGKLLAAVDQAASVLEVRATESGFVRECNAREVGELVRDLGGGRMAKESVLDLAVGVDCLLKPGARVATGDLLGRIHAGSKAAAAAGAARLRTAFEISAEVPEARPLVDGTV